MPGSISNLISRIGSRSPSRPKKEELGKRHRGGFPTAPLSSRSKGCPFDGNPGSRGSSKGSSRSGIIRRRIGTDGNSRRGKVKAVSIVGGKALFLRSIQLPFSMTPHGKKSTSPGLNLRPVCLSNGRKHVGVNKASPRTLWPIRLRTDRLRGLSSQMSKVRTLKEKMGGISTFMQAIRTSRRVSFLHEKKSIRRTMGISKKSFKNKSVGVFRPLFVKCRSEFG